MKNNKDFTSWPIILAYLFMAFVFLFDLLIPIGGSLGVFYSISIIVSIKSKNKKVIIRIAAIASILILIGFFIAPHTNESLHPTLKIVVSILIIWLALYGALYYFSLLKKVILQNEQLIKAQDLGKIGHYKLDINTGNLMWSDQIFKIFKINPKEFQPTYERYLAIVHPDDRLKVKNAYASSFKTNEPYEITYRVMFSDGTVTHVLEKCTTEYTKTGVPIVLLSTVQDITASVELQQKNIEQNKQLEVQNKKLISSEFNLNRQNKNILKYNQIFLDIATINKGSLDDSLQKILVAAANSLEVGRVSYWVFNDTKSEMKCASLYNLKKDSFESGMLLTDRNFPFYFAALKHKKAIVANNAHTNLSTLEFSKAYLTPLGITSMLDVFVHVQGDASGVVCFEHVGKKRVWRSEEVQFAVSISNIFSLIIESFKRKDAENELQNKNEKLAINFSELEEAYQAINIKNESLEINRLKRIALTNEILDTQSLLKNISNIANVGGWQYDLLNEKLTWSDVTKKIHEVPLTYMPVIDKAINFYKEGESRDRIAQVVGEAIEKGTSWNEELIVITAKGKEIWVKAIGEAKMKNGNCVKLHGTFENITVRKKAELKLIKSENEYRSIFNSLTDVFYQMDAAGIIKQISPSVKQVFGYAPNEVIGKSILGFYENVEVMYPQKTRQ